MDPTIGLAGGEKVLFHRSGPNQQGIIEISAGQPWQVDFLGGDLADNSKLKWEFLKADGVAAATIIVQKSADSIFKAEVSGSTVTIHLTDTNEFNVRVVSGMVRKSPASSVQQVHVFSTNDSHLKFDGDAWIGGLFSPSGGTREDLQFKHYELKCRI